MAKDKETLYEMFGKEAVDYLFRITVTTKGGKKFPRDFSGDVQIDYDNIQEELENAPAIFSYWSSVLAQQRLIVDTSKQAIIARTAKKQNEYSNAAKAGDFKMSKYQLDSLVEADDDIIKMKMQLAFDEKKLSVLYGLIKSLEMKSDNLRSLAGFAKMEMKNS